MSKYSVSRRVFLAASGAGAVLAALPGKRGNDQSVANERLRIGFIGVGGRAQEHLKSAITLQNSDQTIEIASVCDVFNRRLDEAVDTVTKGVGKEPKRCSDYRDILADPLNRRRGHRHSRPLAREANDRRPQRQKACLL